METSLREPRPEKVAVVDEVRERLDAASAAILTEYRGLAVKQMEDLRRALRSAGGEYKIYKNTLVRRAVAESGLDELESMLEGPTGIVFVQDDVAAVAKALHDFSRANPFLVVKGGLLGRDLLDARSATALADLPSRDVLLAQIAGALAAPMQRFAALLAAVPQKFAYALQALVDERRGDEPAPAPEAAAEAPAQSAADEAAAEPAPVETAAETPAGESDAAGEPAPAAAAPVEEAAAEAAAVEQAPPPAVSKDEDGEAETAAAEPGEGTAGDGA